MSNIKQIRQEIQKAYRAIEQQEIGAPLSLQVMEWVSFAGQYISAASIIDKQAPHLMLPRLQMTGQAVESALKACLVAAHADIPTGKDGHDIVKLYELASEHGFHLEEPDLAFIVHLGHFYFQDLATSTKYKARFPSKMEQLGGAVPLNSTFVAIVQSLNKQATERNPENTI
jgi:hypothetical protein